MVRYDGFAGQYRWVSLCGNDDTDDNDNDKNNDDDKNSMIVKCEMITMKIMMMMVMISRIGKIVKCVCRFS